MDSVGQVSDVPNAAFPVDIVPILLDAEDDTRRYLTNYFSTDDAIGFTGRFFEQMIGRSDPGEFTPWDLVAVSTLSVDIPPSAAAKILLQGPIRDQLNELLARVPDQHIELADATDDEISDISPAAQMYDLIRTFPDMGPTKTSKLLAAKRPCMFPIRDSVVERILGASDRWWLPMRELSRDERLRELIDRTSADVPSNVTYLRRIDVVLWSHGSNS